jgi:hypothetical protein
VGEPCRDVLDAAIATKALQALKPAELELALATLQELEMRDQAVLGQWHMHLERAEYEAAVAERRYQEVDPSQRAAAATFEPSPIRRSSGNGVSGPVPGGSQQ